MGSEVEGGTDREGQVVMPGAMTLVVNVVSRATEELEVPRRWPW